ncbi:conserved hypothetical protein [Methanohalobium evestigatum Z-7303]|uniref:GTPase n=1 Tax=Methanohalobium evestigatum (strain ATCC BAA-1072 / DSM 3721 / NBRC 107634 / OCM 161 / Z-7303) TaxID=644295 RepID=D7E728_METEZ|nr:hypothetical protein [Methanohalobium evestigatum]ADI73652.1 conserved hypothetical protein [Methanohalobium evestigatum Z-7303]
MTYQKIIFVYNAESGMLNTLSDYFHKMTSPSTYPCNLCAITFGSFGMKNEWKEFINNLDVPVEFLHKDEFLDIYGISDASFPCAYKIKDENSPVLFITSKEINSCKTLDDLKKLVMEKVEKLK